MLGEDDGLKLGLEFQTQAPLTHIILMTGGGFSDELQAVWKERDLPVLYKPFLAHDVVNLVRGRISKATTAAAI
jgi:DNA-binding NtrC family response regulator